MVSLSEQTRSLENKALGTDFSNFVVNDLKPMFAPLLRRKIKGLPGVQIDLNPRGRFETVLHGWGSDSTMPDFRLVVTESEQTYLNNLVIQRKATPDDKLPPDINYVDTHKLNIPEYASQKNRSLWQQFATLLSRYSTDQIFLMSNFQQAIFQHNLEHSQTPFNQAKLAQLRSAIKAPLNL